MWLLTYQLRQHCFHVQHDACCTSNMSCCAGLYTTPQRSSCDPICSINIDLIVQAKRELHSQLSLTYMCNLPQPACIAAEGLTHHFELRAEPPYAVCQLPQPRLQSGKVLWYEVVFVLAQLLSWMQAAHLLHLRLPSANAQPAQHLKAAGQHTHARQCYEQVKSMAMDALQPLVRCQKSTNFNR